MLDAPERWLRGYSAAMERVWAEVEPRWRRAADLLAREAERIEAAAERGGALALTSRRRPRARRRVAAVRASGARKGSACAAGGWCCGRCWRPPSLVEAGEELLSVSYPLTPRHDDSPPASLEGLLAPARATILRALDRPVSAGGLAERHGFSPSGITHHLVALERAGLIERERDGRRVVVQRTLRGTRLLALYE